MSRDRTLTVGLVRMRCGTDPADSVAVGLLAALLPGRRTIHCAPQQGPR